MAHFTQIHQASIDEFIRFQAVILKAQAILDERQYKMLSPDCPSVKDVSDLLTEYNYHFQSNITNLDDISDANFTSLKHNLKTYMLQNIGIQLTSTV